MSQNKTLYKNLISSLLVVFSSMGNGADLKISKIRAANNGQIIYGSTDRAHIFDSDSSRKLPSVGGSSDGGGNSVGRTLFDFYENQGTVELSVAELISLEPAIRKILITLNGAIPAVDTMSSGGFGDILEKSLGTKKIYLESKKINSSDCVNQSMVSTEQQQVVACQSNIEVRFNIKWLETASIQNRAGLVLHEMLLAWARGLKKLDPKNVLEQKVRIVNREIFQGNLQSNILSDLLEKYFEIKVFTPEKIENIKKVSAKIINFDTRHPEIANHNLVKSVFEGVKQGQLSNEVCRYLIESWKDTLPKDIYQSLQQDHLDDINEMCIQN
ncbi:MAG: hypothetical protein ACXVCY_18900 [Pseudobdellovibrionaceae bacterium]